MKSPRAWRAYQDMGESWVVAHACNPSYSEGRDQEDCSSKPAQANVHKTLSQNTLYKNKAGGVAQGEGPEFKPKYHKKKKGHGWGVSRNGHESPSSVNVKVASSKMYPLHTRVQGLVSLTHLFITFLRKHHADPSAHRELAAQRGIVFARGHAASESGQSRA
jgi:hypothetical protein